MEDREQDLSIEEDKGNDNQNGIQNQPVNQGETPPQMNEGAPQQKNGGMPQPNGVPQQGNAGMQYQTRPNGGMPQPNGVPQQGNAGMQYQTRPNGGIPQPGLGMQQQMPPYPQQGMPHQLNGYGMQPQGIPQQNTGYGVQQPAPGMPVQNTGYGMPPVGNGMPGQIVPPPYGYQQRGQEAPEGLAITSMILGIVSIILCMWFYLALPCAIVGLVLGCIYKSKGGRSGMALAGIICSSVGIAFAVIEICFYIIGFSSLWYYY